MNREQIKTERDAYITCALWSSYDDNETPLDANYSHDDLAYEQVFRSRAIVHKFITANLSDCQLWFDTFGEGQIGYDLWLTRNGHGAGFWDRPGSADVLAAGARLSDAARKMGEQDIYVGDDGKVWLS